MGRFGFKMIVLVWAMIGSLEIACFVLLLLLRETDWEEEEEEEL